ncbi:hypothetical protein STEG23_019157, partial [Scotinomys teguina]
EDDEPQDCTSDCTGHLENQSQKNRTDLTNIITNLYPISRSCWIKNLIEESICLHNLR